VAGDRVPEIKITPRPVAVLAVVLPWLAHRDADIAGRAEERGDRGPWLDPDDLADLGDVLVAGRKIEREIEFKVRFASNKVKDYCLRRFCERFAESGHRPESTTYASRNSVFTFIQTKRVTLTPEKVDALKMLKIPVDQFTELKGIRINFEAIRAHKLEQKLRDALAQMGVKKGVLQEVFHPDVQLKEGFFEHLSAVVSRTLKANEDLAEKLYEVIQVLDPAEQIRSADSPNLNPVQSFKLIHDTQIAVSEDLDELED
jgi:hypothetical protein